jgi:hypothetical protein
MIRASFPTRLGKPGVFPLYMDNKASIAGVYGARTTDQREIRIERQGRRSDTSVQPVGLQTCPDRGRANLSRLLHILITLRHYWSPTARKPMSKHRRCASSHAAGIPRLRDQHVKRP